MNGAEAGGTGYGMGTTEQTEQTQTGSACSSKPPSKIPVLLTEMAETMNVTEAVLRNVVECVEGIPGVEADEKEPKAAGLIHDLERLRWKAVRLNDLTNRLLGHFVEE